MANSYGPIMNMIDQGHELADTGVIAIGPLPLLLCYLKCSWVHWLLGSSFPSAAASCAVVKSAGDSTATGDRLPSQEPHLASACLK